MAKSKKSEIDARIVFVLLSALGLTSIGLNFYKLDQESMWGDEISSYSIAKASIFEIIKAPVLVHPPGYPFFLHFWMGFFGYSDFSARAFSAFFVVMSVVMIFFLGKQLFNESVGLVASFLLTFSRFFVYYGQEARTYTLLAFLAILSTFFLVRTINKLEFGLDAWGYVFSSILGLFAHYFFVFMFGVQIGYVILRLLLEKRKTAYEKNMLFLKIILPTALIFGIWALFSFVPRLFSIVSFSELDISWIEKPTVESVAALLKDYSGLGKMPQGAVMVLATAVIVLFAAPILQSLVRKTKLSDLWPEFLVAAAFIGPLAAVFFFSQFKPIFVKRYLIITFPFFMLIIAKAINNLKYRIIIMPVLLLLVFANAQGISDMYKTVQKEDWRAATEYLASSYNEGDLVIMYALPNFLIKHYAPADVVFEQAYMGPLNELTVQREVENLKETTHGRLKIFVVYTYYNVDVKNVPVLDSLLKQADPSFNRASRNTWNHILIDTYEAPVFDPKSNLKAERVYQIPAISFTGKFAKPYNGILPFYSGGDIALYNLELEKGKYIFALEISGDQPGPLYIKYTLGPSAGTLVVSGNLSEWHHYEIPITLERQTSFRGALEFVNDTYIEKNGAVIADNEAFIKNEIGRAHV